MPDTPNAPTAFSRACRDEIEALHAFFEAWLRGTCPATDKAFDRARRALAPTFRLIHPSGDWRTRDDILTGLRGAYGQRPGLTIDVRDVRVQDTGDQLGVATYEEWQHDRSSTDGRLSTVVFRREADAPNGLRWVHVQETGLEAPETEG
jgi:hypothetical protein